MSKTDKPSGVPLRLYTALARLARRRWFWIGCIIAVCVSNIFWLSRNQLNGDVAYYLYAGERIADGAVLYKDIGDMNPPLIYVLEMPLVWIAKTFHSQPHVFWYTGLWLMFAGILLLCHYLGKKLCPRTSLYPLLLFVTVSFGIVDRSEFGQRDQLVAYAFLPLLLSCAGRIAMSAQPRLGAVVASCLAGVSIALKPFFLVPWLFLMIIIAAYIGTRRTARTPEFLVVVVIQTIYAALVLCFFPQYLLVARSAMHYYSAYNESLHAFTPFLPSVGLLLLIITLKFSSPSAGLVMAGTASAFGFLLGAVLQHKAWPYHLLPFRFLSSLVIAMALAAFMQSQYRRRLTRVNITLALWLTGAALVTYSARYATTVDAPSQPESLRSAVQRMVPGRPILVLSTDLWFSFPMIYETRQRLAQRNACLWMIPGLYSDQVRFSSSLLRIGKLKPPQEAHYHLRAEMSNDEKMLFEEIRGALAQKPGIVYVQTGPKQGLGNLKFDFIQYFSSDPEMARALRTYVPWSSSTSDQSWMGRCFTVLVRQGST
jgi:hypothetical protein